MVVSQRVRCVFALLVVMSLPVRAQLDGRISGSVVDASGAAVPGAQVSLFLTGGQKALLVTKTATDGVYHFIGVRPGYFDLSVEAQGFVKTTLRNLSVDPARETTAPAVKLELASVTQNVEVNAQAETVNINNAEISTTVSIEDIRNLPILDRDPIALMQLEPGVVFNANSYTVINGMRTSYSDVTLDGINIQDNYIRDNALDYSPNRPLLSQVREMSMVMSNGNAASSGGATETAYVTPSGTNQFHGETFWENRNNAFSANDWFNNQAGVPLPFLNQNQLGANIGGPIRKDKLFFYAAYEAVRAHQQTPVNNTILTADARQGILQYRDATGALQKVNLLNLVHTSIGSYMQNILNQVPGPQYINNNLVGDGLNTGGYRFNQRDNETRDNFTGKIDYNLTTQHAVSGSFSWNRDNSDGAGPGLENDYSVIPKVTVPTHAALLALSWRWTPTPQLTNEVRAGFNLTYAYFLTSQQFTGGYLVTGEIFSDPVNEFMPQGRNTNTFVVSDDAAWQHGHHYIQFGFHGQQVFVRSYSGSGVVPTYNLLMGFGQTALTPRQLPGINQNDLANANALLATLGGYIDSDSQTFNVTSRTSGFVPDAPYVRHFRMNEYALYVQDKWKISPRLNLTLGLRYELPSVVDETDSLEVQPVFAGTVYQTLLSNATLQFTGGSAGYPWYRRDYMDFAPNIGLAWDVFGDGKTAFRGAYSIFYVNDQNIFAPQSILEANSALQGISSGSGLSNTVSGGVPVITSPAYSMPITVAQEFASNPTNTVGMLDPNLHRPYVQQYSFGIEHEWKETVFEARYVGNHGVGEYRAFDYNQVNVYASGFLTDFLHAQNNGFLAMAQTGGNFNPAYNPRIPGSQPLPVFLRLPGGGQLTNPTIQNLIEFGEAGDLATLYEQNGINGNIQFFANPYAQGSDVLTNYSNSTYNSLQVEVHHRMRSGLSWQANYTFGKTLSDADGDVQSRLQHFLDINNPKLERARANFDLTHAIKAAGYYQFPFGKNHRLHLHALDAVIGGWTFGSVTTWQSGAPFSILSEQGTLNRSSAGRSYYNTADTNLAGSALRNEVSYRMTGNGPMVVNPSAVNPADGTGVAATPNAPPFPGEAFFNPSAGTVGVLQRRMFSGPWTFDIDMSVFKTVTIKEKHTLELRMDAFNALNHPTFWAGDQDINTNYFGLMSSMFFNPRVAQFSLHYRF